MFLEVHIGHGLSIMGSVYECSRYSLYLGNILFLHTLLAWQFIHGRLEMNVWICEDNVYDIASMFENVLVNIFVPYCLYKCGLS